MEKKVIKKFYHEHPLILTETVSETDSSNCYGCGKPVTNLDAAYICMDQHCSNRIILHRRCGELPSEIMHPKHSPDHPIHLFDFHHRRHLCDLCRCNLGQVLGYRCSSCDFDFCITCEIISIDALLDVEKRELQHPCHLDHPLTLMRKTSLEFYCDGCGTRDVDLPYICSLCEFWIHKSCASLPLILPKNPQYHHHDLSLAFSFPKEHLKYILYCDICHKLLKKRCWVYFCGDCRFFAHLKCAASTTETPKHDSNMSPGNSVLLKSQFPSTRLQKPKEVVFLEDQFLFFFNLMASATSSSAATISSNINSVPMLNGTNFKEWKRHLMIVLGCMELDLALREEQPAPLTAASTPNDKRDFERWDRSNRMSLMIMKHSIPDAFRGPDSEEITSAKGFLDEIEQRFAKNDKVEMTSLLTSLMSMKYRGQGNVREYIMEMFHLASKLKALKVELSEELLVLMVLVSLPPQFNQFKISYNCQKEKWSLNELISHCVQEEERLKRDKTESAHFASTSKDRGKKRKFSNEAAKVQTQKAQQQATKACFFCNKSDHMKKECPKYRAWHAKKGLPEPPKAK